MNELCDKRNAVVVLLPAAVRKEFPGTRACRFLVSVLIATLAILLMQAPAFAAIQIPAFTPNIVDPQGYLDSEARQRVDTQLQLIRDQSGIWGAVYVLDTLDGQSIEDLAEKAFKKWELGKAGKDNGLLLVLVMKDRESRFEVGYGLEGSITDVHARRALDDYLAPKMRSGDPAGAIVDAFDYLSLQAMNDPDAVAAGLMDETAGSGALPEWAAGLPLRLAKAFAVLIAFAVAMGALAPLDDWWRNRCIANLLRADPSLPLKPEQLATGTRSKKKKDSLGTMIGALLLLAAIPAVFALAIIWDYPQTFWAFLAAPPVLLVLCTFAFNRKYVSVANYRQHLDGLAEERRQLIEKGHMEETSPGVYKHTAAYHEARRAAASRRSSSSSGSSSRSSSRSSSGGGRSGGGGSSSRW